MLFKRRKRTAFSKGYALFKMLIGFGWTSGAVELFESDSLIGSVACGIMATGFLVESVRTLRKKLHLRW